MNIVLLRLLSYVMGVTRNGLYLPYATALCFYLFFLFMIVAGLFLSNQWGIDLVNSVVSWLVTHSFIDVSGANTTTYTTPEETERFLIYAIIAFGIGYDLLIRIVGFFKNDFDSSAFQTSFLKCVSMFYLITSIFSLAVITFSIKSWPFFWGLFAILAFNAVTLAWAVGITIIFRKITSQIALLSNSRPLP